jgi:hypothetical protein
MAALRLSGSERVDVDPSACDRVARHAVARAGDESAARLREERTLARRHLHVSPCGDMVRLDGMLPALDGAALLSALDALAQPSATEEPFGPERRTRPQLLADALGELAHRQLSTGDLPVHGGVRPNLHLTIDVNDLLTTTGTGRLEGRAATTVAASTIARMGCDATLDWSITTTNPTATGVGLLGGANISAGVLDPVLIGPALLDPATLAALLAQIAPALGGSTPIVLDAGKTTRLVTAPLRKQLIHRDKGCVYPRCDRPPEWCDVNTHHLIHWMIHGPTSLKNLALLCRFHHTRLHLNNQTLQHTPDGWIVIPVTEAAAAAA